MAGTERGWRLYVDESGKFADLTDDVVVAGLLVAGDRPGLAAARQALRQAAPGIAWPLHAALLNRPVLFAMSRCAAIDPVHPAASPGNSRLDHAISEIVRVLSEADPDGFTKSVAFARRGKVPPRPLANAMDRIASEQALADYQIVENQITAMWHGVGRAIASIAKPRRVREAGPDPGSAGPGVPISSQAMLFCAGESARGDAVTDKTLGRERLDSERYLQLLEILFHRTGCALARFPGPHRVWLQVLVRNVFDRQHRWPRPLNAQDLRELADRIEPRFGGRVRFVTGMIPVFDVQASPGDVLADFISNRSHWILAAKNKPLPKVEKSIKRSFRAAVRSGAPKLPHLAASGAAHGFLRGELPTLPDAGSQMRRWAHEQALEWAGAQTTVEEAL